MTEELRLDVGIRYTRVVTGDRGLLRAIDTRFAIEISGRWFSRAFKEGYWDGCTHYFNLEKRIIPTGLLVRLLAFLSELHNTPRIVDHRPVMNPGDPVLSLGKFDLTRPEYDYQAQAVRQALAARRGVLELATNPGKTIVAAAIIETLKVPTLFICGMRDIVLQTEDVFRGALSERDIAVLGGGRRELGMVTICTVQSLHRLVKMRLEELSVFEAMFYDECQHASTDTWYKSGMAIPAPWRFGLSGTAFTGKDEKDYRLISVTGERIDAISNAELIRRGVSAVPTVLFYKSKSERLVWKESKDEHYRDVVGLGIIYNQKRNRQIRDLSLKEAEGGGCVLILTPRSQHAVILWRSLEGRCASWFNHGGLPAPWRRRQLEEFREEGGVMVATTIYDEGIDIPEINTLIIAFGGKSRRKVLQRVGRGLRRKERGLNEVRVIEFYDWHHRHLSRHSLERLRTYRDEEFRVEGGDEGAAVLPAGVVFVP